MTIHPQMTQNDISYQGRCRQIWVPNTYHIGHYLLKPPIFVVPRRMSWFNSSSLPILCIFVPEKLRKSRFFVEHFAQFNIEGKHPQHLVILSPSEIETLELGIGRGKIEETDLATQNRPRPWVNFLLLYIPSKIFSDGQMYPNETKRFNSAHLSSKCV